MSKESIPELDFEAIALAMSQLTTKVISGQPVETIKVTAEFDIPTEIATILEGVSRKTDIPFAQLISSYAKQGFEVSLRDAVAKHTQVKPQPKPTTTGIGIDDLMKGINQSGADLGELTGIFETLKGLSGQLETLRHQVEGMEQSVGITETLKNSE